MDKRKGILNITVSVITRILTMVVALLSQRILIQSCGNDINGLNALFVSIVGFLAIAELGVSHAITFCMYKPIVEGNIPYTAALYRLFQRIYVIIGGVILTLGFGLTPFIPLFAKGYDLLPVDLHFTFALMLVSVVITYWYGPKLSLIEAHKDNYISASITSGGAILQSLMQITALLVTRSFVWFLVCRIVCSLLQGLAVEIVTRQRHRDVLSCKQTLDILDRVEIMQKIKAMFMHKVGGLLVSSADNIIISAFIGVAALGSYNNYNTVLTAVTNLIALVFTSLTSVLGHLYVEKGKNVTKQYAQTFHLINFVLGCLIYLGFYAIIDNLINLLFAEGLLMDRSIVFIITFNAFVQFMRKSVQAFRDATGTFYYDRWKPVIEGVVNIILSILFVQWIGVAGVIAATILTSLLICHVVEPYVLYKHAFSSSPKRYYWINYGMIGIFFVALVVLDRCMQQTANQWLALLVNGFISVGITLAICLLLLIISPTARQLLTRKRKHS